MKNHQNFENRGEKKEKKRFLATVLGAVSGSFKKGHFSYFFTSFFIIFLFSYDFRGFSIFFMIFITFFMIFHNFQNFSWFFIILLTPPSSEKKSTPRKKIFKKSWPLSQKFSGILERLVKNHKKSWKNDLFWTTR